MNSIQNNEENTRPFGFWLKAVDRLMAAEFAAAFESFGVSRREWRLLNRIDGTVTDDARPIPAHKAARLLELGWVTDTDGTWTLTDEGRDAKERLGAIVEGIRAKVTDAVPAEDLATTMATLEQLARAFGWDENTPLPRGRGRRHGSGHGFGHGFDRRGSERRDFGHGDFGPRAFGHGDFRHGGFGHGGFDRPGSGEHAHGEHVHGAHAHGEHAHGEHAHGGHGAHGRGHGRARFARFVQGSYERGFDAGFTRGRDAR